MPTSRPEEMSMSLTDTNDILEPRCRILQQGPSTTVTAEGSVGKKATIVRIEVTGEVDQNLVDKKKLLG